MLVFYPSLDGFRLIPLLEIEPYSFFDFVRLILQPGRPAGIEVMLAQLAAYTSGAAWLPGDKTWPRSLSAI
mgnify:CR=1 FL=1